MCTYCVSYFSAAIAPRELKLWTKVCWFKVVNSKVWDLRVVGLESRNDIDKNPYQ
jgi:hypothetical protein